MGVFMGYIEDTLPVIAVEVVGEPEVLLHCSLDAGFYGATILVPVRIRGQELVVTVQNDDADTMRVVGNEHGMFGNRATNWARDMLFDEFEADEDGRQIAELDLRPVRKVALSAYEAAVASGQGAENGDD
jgi:hypothetical protein